MLALDRWGSAGTLAGSRVLVTAAAGSLGHWLVPLASAGGASVVAAVGGPVKAAAAAALGAHEVVDYREAGWEERLGAPFDVVFDGAGGRTGGVALERTRAGGAFFGYGAASGDFAAGQAAARERGVRVTGVDVPIDDATGRRLIAEGLAMIADGSVRPAVGLRMPLARAAEAHTAMAGREVIGKTVLTVESSGGAEATGRRNYDRA